MSQFFLELQPKTKNCLLEEYNQKTLARIAMSRILLQLQKKHNVMAGNIKKLSIELLAPGMILGFRKENLVQNDVANFVRNFENKLAVGNFVWNCENKTLMAGL
jgi:hypothetical protein